MTTKNKPNSREEPSFAPKNLFGFVILLMLSHGFCKSDMRKGYRLTLAVPPEYSFGFVGRAYLMQTYHMTPRFRVAMSVEAVDNGKFSCSLEVFLGDVKVWNSGHYSKFYVSEKCVLELTNDGDLHLMGPQNRVGWRTGTSGQGVEKLQILKTGNLVLIDAVHGVKWQSFNFPTDVILWGQKLNVATRLVSFPSGSNSTDGQFYSFEIQRHRIALYLHSGKLNYSYWEFKPSNGKNISFIALGSTALGVYNDQGKRFDQILPQMSQKQLQPLKFLALGNKTGNLGLYYYSDNDKNFQASFQALNTTCDLPLACKPCEICAPSRSRSCTGILPEKERDQCGFGRALCGRSKVKMLELEGVASVLRDGPKMANMTRNQCSSMCVNDCNCAAVAYSSAGLECSFYGAVVGVKQVDDQKRGGGSLVYMVKVAKGTARVGGGGHDKRGLKKWVLILVGVIDGLIILVVFYGIAYYLMQKRRKSLACDDPRQ